MSQNTVKTVVVTPAQMFSELYGLPTYTYCKNTRGSVDNCHSVCEPGRTNPARGTSLFLLPGEDVYLRQVFESNSIEWEWKNKPHAVVGIDAECPYFKDGRCRIYRFRPFVCRSYPIRCHKFGEHSLMVYAAQGCRYSKFSVDEMRGDVHSRVWINAWKAVMPHVLDTWWRQFHRACPAGYQLVFYFLDTRDIANRIVPDTLTRQYAGKNCKDCNGSGIDSTSGRVCRCISKSRRKLKHIMDAVVGTPTYTAGVGTSEQSNETTATTHRIRIGVGNGNQEGYQGNQGS